MRAAEISVTAPSNLNVKGAEGKVEGLTSKSGAAAGLEIGSTERRDWKDVEENVRTGR
jgi:hypothetical protein